MTLDALEKRVQVLEDLEAIKKLKASYGKICDDNYKPSEMEKIFTEDAVWEGGELGGTFKGIDQIKEFFAQLSNLVTFSVHYFLPVDITVEEKKAYGQWYLLQSATVRDKEAVWVAGIEDDEYVKKDNKWLISTIRFSKLFFLTPFDEGWVKIRKLVV